MKRKLTLLTALLLAPLAALHAGDESPIVGATRPRNERPPPWCSWLTATPDKTPPTQQKPLIDSVTATSDELAVHIRGALEWTKANRDLNPSHSVIIYGWNENDEGGWLLPTLGTDGKPDDARINALGKILRLK